MKAVVVALLMACCCSAAPADILEWQDAAGVRHFTNLKGEVPKAIRESAQVVVDEVARQPQPAGNVAAPVEAPRARAPSQPSAGDRQAQVIYDRSRPSSAFLEGLQQGLEAARAATANGGSVQINGPLAVASASSPPAYRTYYPPYYYYPFVTPPFDRGRWRHLTWRLLQEDLNALGREPPFDPRFGPQFWHAPLNP
jgi:hypothetical protein